MNPIISIIVPVYKTEKYIARCLESILSQKFQDWECILVDDGSPDESGKICENYAKIDKRFHVFRKENGGVTSARKYGLEQAKGEWIFFCDSDDTLPSISLQNLIETYNGTTEIIVGTCLYKEVEILYHTRLADNSIPPALYIEYLLNHTTPIGPGGKLIKHSLFQNLTLCADRRVTNHEDLLMLIQLAASTKYDIMISNDVVHYISHMRADSASNKPMSYDGCKILLMHLWRILKNYPQITDAIYTAALSYSIRLLRIMCLNHGINIPKDDLYELLTDLDRQHNTSLSKRSKNIVLNPFYRYLYLIKVYIRKLFKK